MSNIKNNYNPYNIEAEFKSYCIDKNYSRISVSNYATDIKSFLTWFSHTLRAQHLEFSFSYFTPLLIRKYIEYLQKTKVPYQRINRILSSLRLFSKFLLYKGYISYNPTTDIKNIKPGYVSLLLFWLKMHIRPIIAFFLGFIFVSFLFILPSLIKGISLPFRNTNDLVLDNKNAIDTSLLKNLTASTSANLMTIPIIDQQGALNLNAPYPKIIGHMGQLSIQAPELYLSSKENGNIKLQTDNGSLFFLFNGEKPNLPFESTVLFSAENLTSGTLILGQTAYESENVSLLELSSGTPKTVKFRVDSKGNVHVSGNIILDGNLIVNPNSTIFGSFSSMSATSSASTPY